MILIDVKKWVTLAQNNDARSNQKRVRNELAWGYSIPSLLAAYEKIFKRFKPIDFQLPKIVGVLSLIVSLGFIILWFGRKLNTK